MKIIVGLGNPGKEFEETRHNVGFMVVDRIAEIKKLRNWKLREKIKAEIIELKNLILIKPQTYMNSSGESIKKIPQYLNISISQFLSNLYIIHDDLDIELGKYKIQFGKGPKQHNGVLSIEEHLKTKDFWRVRIGTKNDELRIMNYELKGRDFVLGKFSKEEKEILDKVIDKVIKELIERVF